jgi:hypothetical protein
MALFAAGPKRLSVVSLVDDQFLQQAEAARDSIPKAIWDSVNQAGWSVQLAEFVIDAAPYLQGRHPRGWPIGMAWENTDAVHLPDQRLIIVAEKRRTTRGEIVKAVRVGGVFRHEMGHAIDRIQGKQGWRLTDSSEFRRCYDSDLERIADRDRTDLAYYTQAAPVGPRETFAELFAILYGGGSDDSNRKMLNDAFPRTRKFLQDSFPSVRQPSSRNPPPKTSRTVE